MEPTSEQPRRRTRKVAPNAELPAWAAPTPAPLPQSAQDELYEKYREHIDIGTWAGLPNYECNYCDHATVEGLLQAIDHYESKHMVPPVPVAPSAIVGPSGEQLQSTLPPEQHEGGEVNA